jgi:DHA1 family bicyclomycin/chloramphenicol resistance-like MFS transporter
MVLDLVPERRGLASSLQAVVGSVANAVVAGALAPTVMHSSLGLSVASFGMMCIGLLAWQIVRRKLLTH